VARIFLTLRLQHVHYSLVIAVNTVGSWSHEAEALK